MKDSARCFNPLISVAFVLSLGLAPGTAHHIFTVLREWDKLDEVNCNYQVRSARMSSEIVQMLNTYM